MHDIINRYLAFSEEDRLFFSLGRFGGALHPTGDLDDGETRSRLKRAPCNLETEAGMDLERSVQSPLSLDAHPVIRVICKGPTPSGKFESVRHSRMGGGNIC